MMLCALHSLAPQQVRRLIAGYVLTVFGGLLQGAIFASAIVGLSLLLDTGAVPWAVFAGALVALVSSIAALRASDRIRASATRRAARAVVERTARHAARLPLGWFTPSNRRRLGRVIEGVPEVEFALRWLYSNIAMACSCVVVSVTLLAVFVHPAAAAAVGLAAAATMAGGAVARRPIARAARAQETAGADAGARLIEYAQTHPVLRAFAGARRAAASVLDAYTRLDVASRRVALIRIGATVALPEVLGALALTSVAIIGSVVGAPVPAVVLGLVATVLQVAWLAPIGRMWGWIDDARIILDTARGVCDTVPLPEANPARPLPTSSGLSVEFRDVGFSYGGGAAGVEAVSFRVAPNSSLALVGPSGAGKSTVLQLAARFWDVTSGAVLVGGVDVRDVAGAELLKAFAIVFQDVYLFEGTLRENVLQARPQASEAELTDAATRANLMEVVAVLPGGWEAQVGERGVALSGGQRQRVSIARALLKDAPIVLLDEPTAALDAESQHLLNASIRELARDRTVITVTHQLSSAAHADQIVFLSAGRVLEVGGHEQLLAARGAYADAWHRQHDKVRTS